MRITFKLLGMILSCVLTLTTRGYGADVLYPLQIQPPLLPISLQAKVHPNQKGYILTRVREGETLAAIVSAYNADLTQALKQMKLKANTPLRPGKLLRIPVRGTWQKPAKLPPGVIRHVVASGETLSDIQARYGLSLVDLISANPYVASLDRLSAGTELLIPSATRGLILKVKKQQNILFLAEFYQVDVGVLARANNLRSPLDITAGDYILLPDVEAHGKLEALNKRREWELERERKIAAMERYQRYLAYVAQRKKEQELERIAAIAREQKRKEQAALAAKEKQQAQKVRNAQVAKPQEVQRASYKQSSGNWSWPVYNFKLTSGYGYRNFFIRGPGNFHTGIDLGAPTGTAIYAAHSGYVTRSGWGNYGINVYVDSGSVTAIYGHMSRAVARYGAYVNKGDVIGYVGCTGICTGPHLHFEIQVAGRHVNPRAYLP